MKPEEYGKNMVKIEDEENRLEAKVKSLEREIEKSKIAENKVKKAIRATSRKIEITFNLEK